MVLNRRTYTSSRIVYWRIYTSARAERVNAITLLDMTNASKQHPPWRHVVTTSQTWLSRNMHECNELPSWWYDSSHCRHQWTHFLYTVIPNRDVYWLPTFQPLLCCHVIGMLSTTATLVSKYNTKPTAAFLTCANWIPYHITTELLAYDLLYAYDCSGKC